MRTDLAIEAKELVGDEIPGVEQKEEKPKKRTRKPSARKAAKADE